MVKVEKDERVRLQSHNLTIREKIKTKSFWAHIRYRMVSRM
jgi:hypothetical protein